MLLIPCPYCGPRAESEFHYGGEAHIARPQPHSPPTPHALAETLYMRQNKKGVMAERWHHRYGCGQFFNALRDTMSDQFLDTYKIGAPKPDIAAAKENKD